MNCRRYVAVAAINGFPVAFPNRFSVFMPLVDMTKQNVNTQAGSFFDVYANVLEHGLVRLNPASASIVRGRRGSRLNIRRGGGRGVRRGFLRRFDLFHGIIQDSRHAGDANRHRRESFLAGLVNAVVAELDEQGRAPRLVVKLV